MPPPRSSPAMNSGGERGGGRWRCEFYARHDLLQINRAIDGGATHR